MTKAIFLLLSSTFLSAAFAGYESPEFSYTPPSSEELQAQMKEASVEDGDFKIREEGPARSFAGKSAGKSKDERSPDSAPVSYPSEKSPKMWKWNKEAR